jgi:hypothetical protein
MVCVVSFGLDDNFQFFQPLEYFLNQGHKLVDFNTGEVLP